MGVHGLWQVIQPCARPTSLASLNRKRLAVDASIWIYQFLKAVRDKEGNALRNSHVVGFFRRICKLLWFGIQPVFVFDGGAPALKRATLQGRRRRREGRREDAVRTAGKLLAVRMQRIAAEEDERRRARAGREQHGDGAAPAEELPDLDNMVYADEAFTTTKAERQKGRRFTKQDQYHLPDLDTSIDQMGKPDDPRIMSVEELEEYARQFNNGEDVNLYDFSKIDFDGEFFKSLPPADRYNILNAARIRSRLRMGLSKEQLDEMFPNRMDFSRFQIERVQERNHLTQRLMFEMKMAGTDLTMNGGGRIAGEKDREYILVKNEGVDGGYALGVVSKDKEAGTINKPVDVDALQFQYQAKDEDEDEWEDEDFEDVPIEGLNRLPKIGSERQRDSNSRPDEGAVDNENDNSLFVDDGQDVDGLFESRGQENDLFADEEEDLRRAIAMSLQNQHCVEDQKDEEEDEEFEDVPVPQWTQKAVEAPKPITSSNGKMVAHIINNRASAAVPRRKASDASSDSDDFQSALAAARRNKAATKPQAKPVQFNVKNPFDGPLPFEKLDWRTPISGKKPMPKSQEPEKKDVSAESGGGFHIEVHSDDGEPHSEDEELEGGFEKAPTDDAPLPLPPWMIHGDRDIRDSLKEQQRLENEVNEEDQALVREEGQRRRRRLQNEVVEIESSDDDGDVEIIDAPPAKLVSAVKAGQTEKVEAAGGSTVAIPTPPQARSEEDALQATSPAADDSQAPQKVATPVPEAQAEKSQNPSQDSAASASPEVEFENVDLSPQDHAEDVEQVEAEERPGSEEPMFEDVELPLPNHAKNTARTESEEQPASDEPMPDGVAPKRAEDIAPAADAMQDDEDGLFAEGEYDEFSDPEDDELLAQMAEEAEEHARFASQLNHKPALQNQEDYERELRALRSQQKKDRRDADEVTQIMVTECQALLRLFGIPYITAPMEAEAQCAELVHLGLVDGIVTDDSDTFLFGGTRVYKNMFNSNKYVECYLSGDMEKELSLSREQLISIAHLLGSDYTEGIPGIGPVTAVEILSEFPGREGLAAFREWWADVQQNNRPKEADSASPFRRKFRKSQAAKIFLPPAFPSPAVFEAYLKPEVDNSPEQFQWGVPDLEGLRQFLMATIGWSRERTDEVLVPVIKDLNRRQMEGTQSNITRYFDGGVGVGAKEAFAPRHRVRGSKRMTAAMDRLRNKSMGDDEPSVRDAPGSSYGTKKRKARASAVVVDDGRRSDDDDDNDEPGDLEIAGARKKRRVKGKGKRVKA